MSAFRRAVLAVGAAGAIASALRLVVLNRRSPSAPAAGGGWRELRGTELT